MAPLTKKIPDPWRMASSYRRFVSATRLANACFHSAVVNTQGRLCKIPARPASRAGPSVVPQVVPR